MRKIKRIITQGIHVDGHEVMAQIEQDVQSALKVLDSETVKELVGQDTADLAAMQRGLQGVMTVLYVAQRQQGLRENDASVREIGQALLMASAIVQQAYALGIRKGRAGV